MHISFTNIYIYIFILQVTVYVIHTPVLLNLGRHSGVHDSASLKEAEPVTRLKMRWMSVGRVRRESERGKVKNTKEKKGQRTNKKERKV